MNKRAIVFIRQQSAVYLPTVTTTTITNIDTETATSGGNITNNGGAIITARGVCWNVTANPTISSYHTSDGTGSGIFTSELTGLTPGTTYHVRAYATNVVGTTYGTDLQFTSVTTSATVFNDAITSITSSTAIAHGEVEDDGGSSVTERGVCWGLTTNPTIYGTHNSEGSGVGIFDSTMTSLSANTLYYVRAYAINAGGTAYGSNVTFTTLK